MVCSFHVSQLKFCTHLLPPFAQYKRDPSNHSDMISQWTKNMKCLIKQFVQLPNAPRLVSCILLSTLLSQFPNLCFPVGYQLCVNEFSKSYKMYS